MVDIQHLGITDNDFLTTPEQDIVDQLHSTMYRNKEGRYVVEYPIKYCIRQLDSQFPAALTRLKSTTEKLKKDPALWKTVQETIQKQLDDEIISEINVDDPLPQDSLPPHYLPHHLVKKDSATPAYRMVLDPTFIADVEKAFHQVEIAPKHRAICRWLMVKDLNKPVTAHNIRVFEFNRLSFGLVPSPFMLQEVIKEHVMQNAGELGPETMMNMYVDNLSFQAADDEEA
ncbi:unnamed protein product [Bursaphelenchus okinawaensis]|uniref:Reverse transcriptase domain-containing protein n=1 Tax=Bursaphelenchus okinawaensis TaxID=465554 RepID=A0A811K873_9BILA|nr:unnamed protein product [Bursaphelenchus okinawaensis]CAG9094757.1 unnamed protein product [Bursaphelenchus okinawaensis]